MGLNTRHGTMLAYLSSRKPEGLSGTYPHAVLGAEEYASKRGSTFEAHNYH